MPRHRLLAAALSLLAFGSLALAACGGESAPEPSPTATGDPPLAAEMDQDNLAFKPNAITLAVGGQVTFRNSESAIHTVTIERKNESGTMKKGDVFLWSPPAAGSYKITCDFHAKMRATVTVK